MWCQVLTPFYAFTGIFIATLQIVCYISPQRMHHEPNPCTNDEVTYKHGYNLCFGTRWRDRSQLYPHETFGMLEAFVLIQLFVKNISLCGSSEAEGQFSDSSLSHWLLHRFPLSCLWLDTSMALVFEVQVVIFCALRSAGVASLSSVRPSSPRHPSLHFQRWH